MNPNTLLPAMESRLSSLIIQLQPVSEDENTEFKTEKLRIKIDLVSHTARVVVFIKINK